MTQEEVYEQLCLRVPVKQYNADPADFRGVLQRYRLRLRKADMKQYVVLPLHE